QAEDRIRAYKVTGVQTCALPILPRSSPSLKLMSRPLSDPPAGAMGSTPVYPRPFRMSAARRSKSCWLSKSSSARRVWLNTIDSRSEERRVGEEGRATCVVVYMDE